MVGMSEVGRLFNNNELIVAEVLQSAEAMKAAVDYLEGFIEKGGGKSAGSARGRIILATVKGDVHDIGKNLVEIILANNGYEVINLGIKVPPEALIQAYFEHQPDAIGLSGLLVKSTQQMVATASDFKAAGIRVPLLVGGAALSEKFTRTKIANAYGEAAYYAKDAMAGLKWMNQIMDPAERDAVLAQLAGGRTSNGKSRLRMPLPGSSPRSAAPRFAPPLRFHPRRIWTAKSARCRISPRYGATSIRICSTDGIWATRAISKRACRNATRKR